MYQTKQGDEIKFLILNSAVIMFLANFLPTLSLGNTYKLYYESGQKIDVALLKKREDNRYPPLIQDPVYAL